jgi:hypothetical protein
LGIVIGYWLLVIRGVSGLGKKVEGYGVSVIFPALRENRVELTSKFQPETPLITNNG